MSSLFWGIYREVLHSPNRESDDERILTCTAERLREAGVEVVLRHPEEGPFPSSQRRPDLVFFMCERLPVLSALAPLEEAGTILVNAPSAVRNTYRDRMIPLLARLGDSFPRSRLVDTADGVGLRDARVWIKRGDFHQTQAGDVVFAENPSSLHEALVALRERGIQSAVVQRHLEGDLLKFYGIGRETGPGSWFHSFYHKEQVVAGYPFSPDELERLARRAAEILGLEVFGGDAIVSKDGAISLIDVNAWPSFALYRDEASARIARYLLGRLEEKRKRKGEGS